MREVWAERARIIDQLSVDEAYLDVTENLQHIPLAGDVALAIRAKIKEVTPATRRVEAGLRFPSGWNVVGLFPRVEPLALPAETASSRSGRRSGSPRWRAPPNASRPSSPCPRYRNRRTFSGQPREQPSHRACSVKTRRPRRRGI